ILPLDIAIGIGGLPRGRIIEIYGPEAGGKTTVALHMIASMQAHGGTAAFIDAEHALDPVYAKRLGVDIEELLLAQPDTGEQGLEIADSLISSGAVDMVVIDSVAALVPKSEIEGDMGDSHVGLHARMMSQAMRKLAGVINKTNTVVIFINQIREKVGVMFGNPETTTGGRALKFYSSVRLEVRKGEAIKQGTEIIGNRVKVKVAKNKVAPPFKTADFDIIYGEGFSRLGSIIDMGVEFEIVRKAGAYLYYNEQKLGQGKDNARKYLQDNPNIADEIEAKILASVRKNVVPSEQPAEVEEEEEFVEED
ncbi:MAG: recombinase RecA, partial [Selenomonadaceae bacterium]|nr:recombinase RecA [Selenomonadaceae bacterium]